MADADGVGVLQITLVEHGHIVVVADLQHVGIAALAGVVIEPVADDAVIVAGVPGIVIGGLFVGSGGSFQRGAALVGGQDLVGRSLGGLLGSGGFLVGGLDGVAVGIGGGFGGAADHHILPGDPVIGLGIGLVSVLDLRVRIGQAVGIGAGVGLILQGAQQLLAVDLLGHGAAQVLLKVLVDGGAAAHGGILQGLHGVLVLGLHACGILIAGFLGGLQAVLDHGHLLDGVVHHVVVPGGAFLHAQHGRGGGVDGLVLQGGVGVQSQIADEVGVVLQEAAVNALIIEVDLSGGVLLTVDGDGGGGAGNDVGPPDQADHHGHQEQHADDAVEQVAALFSLLLLQLLKGLGIGAAGDRVLPELFFS